MPDLRPENVSSNPADFANLGFDIDDDADNLIQ